MNTFLLELLAKQGIKTIVVKGTDTEDYGRVVPVIYPAIDITTEDGRSTVSINCSALDEITEIYIDNDPKSYNIDTLHELLFRK